MAEHEFVTTNLSKKDSSWNCNIFSPKEKKFRVQQSIKKVMQRIFLSMKRPITIDFLEKGATVNSFVLQTQWAKVTLFIEWLLYIYIYIYIYILDNIIHDEMAWNRTWKLEVGFKIILFPLQHTNSFKHNWKGSEIRKKGIYCFIYFMRIYCVMI